MSLCTVSLSVDVMAVCMQHALSIETEEIMGLLIGEVDSVNNCMEIVTSMTLVRSDKKPDRVEISEEQLVNASIFAEKLSDTYKRPLRVIGWYHSHPHITVWPSSIDLRTQVMYQGMDKDFVGLIFSVFVKNKLDARNEIDVTCFRTTQTTPYQRINVPMRIVPGKKKYFPLFMKSIQEIHKVFINEENEAYTKESFGENNALVEIHNKCTKDIALVNITEKVIQPTLNSLHMKNKCADIRYQSLVEYRDFLTAKLNSTQQVTRL